MAKQAKKKQTDWTKQGKSIADTSVPLYKDALNLQADYLSNPTQYLDEYLNKYWSNNANQSDFLRQYNRAMSNTTANNYAATTGGYTSAGQRAYDDQQRYQNDLASRLQTQGVNQAGNLVNQWYGNLNTGIGNYRNAYALGQPYSDIDQYNYIAKQGNSWTNQIGSALPAVGAAVGSIFSPVGSALGSALGSAIGGAISTDTSSALNSIGSSAGGSGSNWTNLANMITGAASAANKQGGWANLFKSGGGNDNTTTQPTENTSTGLFDPNSKGYWQNQIGRING